MYKSYHFDNFWRGWGDIEPETNNGVFVLVNEIPLFNLKTHLPYCNTSRYTLKSRYVYDICKIKLTKVRISYYM